MSKTQRSSSRTHSRSASRSRSRSESHSCSRSRSSSRSRSRKHRYGSRSRSRSRSHSPSHNRERKHPRDFQNHREFRGYHRGFRRPYYFRGRGRGFFRGHFQRGGGGGGGRGYNNRSNNWQNFQQYPQQKQHHKQEQQQQQQQYDHSPKRGRSRSCSPKKRSNSPLQSHSHSRRSDRSSSPHSHHSSSSNSSRPRSGSTKHVCAARVDVSTPKESHKNGGGDEALAEQAGCPLEAEAPGDRAPAICLVSTSPKTASSHVACAVTAGQGDSTTNETGPVSISSGATSNGSTCWQTVASAPSTNSLLKSPTTVFSSFGLFSNVDQPDEDTVAISIAFKKFLEEQKSKKQAAIENGIQKVASNGEALAEKKSSKSEDNFNRASSLVVSRATDHNDKREREKYKNDVSVNTDLPFGCSLKMPQFLCEGREEEEDEQTEPHLQMRDVDNATSKYKSRVAMSARELFEEHVSRLEDIAWDDELEAFLLSRKQERAKSLLAALSKREKLAQKFRERSPERPSKVKQKEKTTSSASPKYAALSQRSSENREQEMFLNMTEKSPPRSSGQKGTEFNLIMDALNDDLARSSVLSNNWKNSMDLVHPDKKEQEFHSVFQHIPCNNLCRSPSELFAQHVVAIVHHIKAQYFPSSGMTLNDRFAMYQRLAAEKEIMKQRKSPEIHRRIDVSPSAFKRHSLLFDELKSSGDSSFKVDGKQLKGDKMDLRLDIEWRKKYLSVETNDKQKGTRESGESGVERSNEESSKHHKKSQKSKKKRERSHSSSSSSSSLFQEEEVESMEEGFSHAQQQLRECAGSMERGQGRGGFQFRIRGRGWNRGNSHGNNTNGICSAYMPMNQKKEEWDPEDIAKCRKYYLQNRKDGEGERKWAEPRGRGQVSVPRAKGRFILRRPTSSITTNNSSSNWSYDKFRAIGEDGVQPDNNTEQNNNKQNST